MRNRSGNVTDEEKRYYAEARRTFALMAPFYDIVARPLSGLRERVVDLAGAKSGARVLDIGTGTGEQAFAFARRGYDVVGVDLSEAMLRVARRKSKHSNVRFEVADVTSLPLEDGAFDVVCLSFVLHEMPLTVRAKALKEVVRVTRPGGMVVVVDYGLPANRAGRFLVYHLVRLYECRHYSEFVRSDLEGLLKEHGVEIRNGLQALGGLARALKGVRAG